MDEGFALRHDRHRRRAGRRLRGRPARRRRRRWRERGAAARCAGLPLTLLLEPGRSLVAPAGVAADARARVKENGGKRSSIVDAGMNDLLRPALYQAYHRIEPVRESAAPVRRRRRRRPGLRDGRLPGPRPRAGPVRSPATCWPCATRAPTASRWRRTTTCARAPPRPGRGRRGAPHPPPRDLRGPHRDGGVGTSSGSNARPLGNPHCRRRAVVRAKRCSRAISR